MSHSISRIWIHAIWSTKDRRPLIRKSEEPLIHDFLQILFQDMDCSVKALHVMSDHLHVLFLLHPKKSLSEVIKYVKGSSSHIINQQELTLEKFSWQSGYAAFSVSGTSVDKVASYIHTQKEYHAQKTFHSEFNEILIDHGFEIET